MTGMENIENNKKPILLYVVWEDTSSWKGWHTPEETEDWSDNSGWVIFQVGWLLKETKDYLIISDSFTPPDYIGEAHISSPTKIPKGWIKKLQVLSGGGKKLKD